MFDKLEINSQSSVFPYTIKTTWTKAGKVRGTTQTTTLTLKQVETFSSQAVSFPADVM